MPFISTIAVKVACHDAAGDAETPPYARLLLHPPNVGSCMLTLPLSLLLRGKELVRSRADPDLSVVPSPPFFAQSTFILEKTWRVPTAMERSSSGSVCSVADLGAALMVVFHCLCPGIGEIRAGIISSDFEWKAQRCSALCRVLTLSIGPKDKHC